MEAKPIDVHYVKLRGEESTIYKRDTLKYTHDIYTLPVQAKSKLKSIRFPSIRI